MLRANNSTQKRRDTKTQRKKCVFLRLCVSALNYLAQPHQLVSKNHRIYNPNRFYNHSYSSPFLFILLLFIITSCSSSESLDDFHEEGQAISRALIVKLRQIRTRDDLLLHQADLEILF